MPELFNLGRRLDSLGNALRAGEINRPKFLAISEHIVSDANHRALVGARYSNSQRQPREANLIYIRNYLRTARSFSLIQKSLVKCFVLGYFPPERTCVDRHYTFVILDPWPIHLRCKGGVNERASGNSLRYLDFEDVRAVPGRQTRRMPP